MIPQHTIDQILDRVDLVEIIGQRVKLKKSGRTYSGCCPFHQEKSPSFHVYRDKGYYHCFGCQANGNAIKFLMNIDNRSFIDVMQDLAQQAGVELPKDDKLNPKTTYKRQAVNATQNTSTEHNTTTVTTSAPTTNAAQHAPLDSSVPHQTADLSAGFDDGYFNAIDANNDFDFANTLPFEDSFHQHSQSEHAFFDPRFEQAFEAIDFQSNLGEDVSLYDLLENVATFYQQQLSKAVHAQNYFSNRKLSEKTIQDWRLGYAPTDWQHLEKVFPQDIQGLKLLGLIRENEPGKSFNLLRDRVIFPIRDRKGRVVGFGGRALNDDIKPKYINSPDSEVFHKNQLLFGLYEGRQQKANDWLMVEGYMDVIALHQAGICGAVATLGTASNAEHLNQLFKQNSKLTLAFDGDKAGQNAAWRTLEIALPLLNDGRELRFFILPDQHDPDSLIQQIGLEKFQNLLQQAPLLSDFLFAQLSKKYQVNTPEGKGMLMAELNQLTQNLPKGNYKYLLSQSFRDRLGFGKKQKSQTNQDQDLQFSRLDKVQVMLALVLTYPILLPHFQPLKSLFPANSLELAVFNCLEKIYPDLPAELEQSRFFALGACYQLHEQLLPLLDNIGLEELDLDQPENIEQHAQALVTALKYDYLQQKMKQPNSIQESKRLLQELHQIRQQLNRTVIQS
ncbi:MULTISPECIES: DNA primase [unclassified Acinetobacter]|uniref:DNA primase n=1 Tax=unclassified Acinetobacter TaxID=196816 RepID=UPI0035B77177